MLLIWERIFFLVKLVEVCDVWLVLLDVVFFDVCFFFDLGDDRVICILNVNLFVWGV